MMMPAERGTSQRKTKENHMKRMIPTVGASLLMAAVLPLCAAETTPAQQPAGTTTVSSGPIAVAAPQEQKGADVNAEADLAFIPEVVAKFGDGKTVTGAELKKLILPAIKMAAAQGQRPTAEELRSMAREATGALVDMAVLREVAAKDGIKEDLAAAEKELLTQAGGEENLTMVLSMQGGDRKDLVSKVATMLMIQQWVEAKIKPGVKVEDDVIKKFYDEHKEYFQTPERLCASHILVKVDAGADAAAKQAARAKAEQILADLKKGADFTKLAAEKSDDPGSKDKGGTYEFSKGEMVPEFEEAALKLKKDELGGIVETEFGYHVMKGGGTKPAGQVPLETVKDQIKMNLVNQELGKAVEAKVAELRKAANVQILLPGEKKVEAEKPAAPAAPKK